MTKRFLTLVTISLVLCLAMTTTVSLGKAPKKETDKKAEKPAGKTYLLRYHFKPGETIQWEVFHHGRTHTTVTDTTQTSEMITKSVKIWKVIKINDDQSIVFENQTKDVDMWHKMTGCEEVHYNSKKDKEPPHGFEEVAERVGKPLARVTIDPLGKVKKRVDLVGKKSEDLQTPLTIPLPKKAVPVGHTWRIPHDVYVPLDKGELTKKVLVHQVFTLKSVKNDVATIDLVTQILTPINNPSIEVKLINQYTRNTIRFDIKLGRIILQKQKLDKKVVGFRGPDSRVHYLTKVTERLKTQK